MVLYFLIGCGLLVLGLASLRWLARANRVQLIRALRWLMTVAVVLVGAYFIATGKVVQAAFLAFALGPLWVRWRALLSRLANAGGPSGGQNSTLETRYLRVFLEHDSGAMDGVVLAGRYSGARLSELKLDDLIVLLGECRIEDPDAASVLEAYLDRVWPAWREVAAGSGTDARSTPPTPSTAMSREEAYSVLGLKPGADVASIRAAHRQLMMKLHPDQGGSTYLAARVNMAKDVLLGE